MLYWVMVADDCVVACREGVAGLSRRGRVAGTLAALWDDQQCVRPASRKALMLLSCSLTRSSVAVFLLPFLLLGRLLLVVLILYPDPFATDILPYVSPTGLPLELMTEDKRTLLRATLRELSGLHSR
uniref:Uncharacterized protein n=1 Tax=Anopheles farauti TaxID=69004 RepID=A0A182R0I8_9DIPT